MEVDRVSNLSEEGIVTEWTTARECLPREVLAFVAFKYFYSA